MMPRRAFTLLEGLLTILLLGLFFGLAYPDFDKLFRARRMEESAERLRSLIIMTRSRSMREGIRYRIQFPGTPDPLDKFAEKEIDVPFETVQPEVFRQDRPIEFPDSFVKVEDEWAVEGPFLHDGIRCVASYFGTNFDETAGCKVVGPAVSEGKREFVPLTFNPDGTCDSITFRLTDYPVEVQAAEVEPTRVVDLIVDGRTGQTWFQRAFTIDEKKIMDEYHASPILHMDFNRAEPITEENILMINVDQRGVPTGSRRPQQSAAPGGGQ
jgi:type II secretory pathway pseudopilin PulG